MHIYGKAVASGAPGSPALSSFPPPLARDSEAPAPCTTLPQSGVVYGQREGRAADAGTGGLWEAPIPIPLCSTVAGSMMGKVRGVVAREAEVLTDRVELPAPPMSTPVSMVALPMVPHRRAPTLHRPKHGDRGRT